MEDIRFSTDRFSKDEQDTEIRAWRGKYNGLVSRLGELGTEVRVTRTFESDSDTAPYQFVRGAVHEFTFPPQATTDVDDRSRVIDDTPGYSLFRQDIKRDYDRSLEQGRLKVTYDDSESCVRFAMSDALEGGSSFEEGVLEAMRQIVPAEAEAAER